MKVIEAVVEALAGLLIIGRTLLFAWAGFVTRRIARKSQQIEHDLCKVHTWKCADCGSTFGEESTIIFYGGSEQSNSLMIEGKPFVSWFVATCAHCRRLRSYSRSGEPFPLGSLVPDDLEGASGDEPLECIELPRRQD